jgi:hypothetical protein
MARGERTLMGPTAQVTPRAPQSAEASAAPDTETHEQTKDFGVDQRPDALKGVRKGHAPIWIPSETAGAEYTATRDRARDEMTRLLTAAEPVATKSAQLPVEIPTFEC